jgi:catechol 2,3-dioxygenase-like lactoylglutathione lyase family enzyme
MTIKRLDHVSVVVDDLAAAIAFFTALGMTLEGEMPVEGPWVDRVNGLESVQVDIVMMRTPDGHGRLELTKFRNPKLVEIEPAIAPPNTLGLRSVMFTVESVDDTVARLRANGAELVGEVAQYEDKYRLCYMRGTLLKRSPLRRNRWRARRSFDSIPWLATILLSRLLAPRFC